MLCRTETFGPVVAIYKVSSDEQAIALANDTSYGLNASVWGSKTRAESVAVQIQAGSVNVNERIHRLPGHPPMLPWVVSKNQE